MSKQYTVPELAKSIGCSRNLIGKLIRAGKIPTNQNGAKKHHLISMPKYEVEKIVNEHTKGRYGFKKNGKAAAKPVAKKGNLQIFSAWIALEKSTRELLIKLSEKYSDDELELLLNL